MFLLRKVDRKTWPVRILSYGLLLAIFFLSFHFELDTAIAAGKGTYSSIAKVRKDFRYDNGGQPEVALTTALADWTPTFHPYFLRVVDKQNLPASHLLKSIRTRAPPSTHSI